MFKKTVFLFIVSMLFLAANVFALDAKPQGELEEKVEAVSSAAAFDSEENFGKWVTYYYLQPEPEKTSGAIKYYADSTLFSKASSRVTMAAFYAALFKNDPKLMEKSFVDISASGSNNAKEVLLRALWLINSAESKELINKASQDWKSEEITKQLQDVMTTTPLDMLKDPIKDAAQLDMLWSTFLATGEDAPVKRIISVMHFVKDGKGMDMLIGGAAQWSMGSNAMQHKKVYAICKEEIKTSDPITSQMLQEIVDKVDGKTGK